MYRHAGELIRKRVARHHAYTVNMSMVNNNPWQQHIDAELALLRASPQLQSVSSLERGEQLLAEHAERLSIDESLLVLRICASGCEAAGRWLDGLQFAQRGLELCLRKSSLGGPRNAMDRVPFLQINGNIHLLLRNFHLAVRSLREAMLVAERANSMADVAKLTLGLGSVYSRLDEHDLALSLFERAEMLAREFDLPAAYSAALNNVAREYCLVGRTDAAQQMVDDAIGVLTDQGNRNSLPYLLRTRADIAASKGNVVAALHDLGVAATLLRQLQNIPDLSSVLLDTAELLTQRGELAAAREVLAEASELSVDASLHDLRAKIWLARARLAQREGNAACALAAVNQFLAAQRDAQRIEIEGQRIATRFMEEVERSEARDRRESEAASALTLRLLETQIDAEASARKAARDPLTGVLNRSAFEAAAMRAASGQQHPATLIKLDVDDFKPINDQFGPMAGDAVLVAMADWLRQCSRANDLLGRYGGDEFLLLCPGVGPRVALAIVNRMLARVSQAPVRYGGHDIRFTVSLGAACTQTKALPAFEYLMKRADAALRRAKLAGKNRAVIVRVNV